MTYSAIRARINEIDLVSSSARPLAGGDNAPVGSRYLQTNGISWMKSGSTATSWTKHLLRAPYFNVRTYGATGDGATDDRAAIELARLAAKAAGGGVVFFPPGDYACFQSTPTGIFTLTGEADGKVIWLGCGRSSRILMCGVGVSDRNLFRVMDGCKWVGFSNLYMASELVAETEQQHLIVFENRSTSVDAETGQSFVRDCYFGQVRGDAVRFLGNSTNRVAKVNCRRLVFQMAATGRRSRSAFQFQRAVDDVTIDGCYATADSSAIDFEPTGVGSDSQHRFTRNHFIGDVALTGNGAAPNAHIRSVFSNNTVYGNVASLDISYFVVSQNIVDNESVGALGMPAFEASDRAKSAVIADNYFHRQGDTLTPGCLSVTYHSVGDNESLVIEGNIAINDNNTANGSAINVQNAKKVTISNNLCQLKVNVASAGNIIRVEGTTQAEEDTVCVGNLCVGTGSAVKYGIIMGGGNTLARGNVTRNVTNGLGLTGTQTGAYMATGNILDGASNSISLVGGVPVYAFIGGADATTPAVYTCIASPETNIVAAIGSIALRTFGGGAATTLYVKQTGAGLATGWVGK